MRNAIIILAAAGVTAQVGAVNLDPKAVWAGAKTDNPVNYTPQGLASQRHALNSDELKKVHTDNGVWYTWQEPDLKDFDWMMFVFDNNHPDAATLNWQIGIDDDDNKVYLFYWYSPNEAWVVFDNNEGGRNPPPPTRHPDVTDEMNHDPGAGSFIVLAVGYTPGAGNWISCDVCDIDQ